MDFHSLTRRELQALCKKNNIPANTTNIAMANALKALDIVEGMEEFYNPSSAVSPGKTVMASPYVPCTGGRTSTRKKTIKEESESVQITTRARRGTRKAVAREVEVAKFDLAETPGNKSIRKREPVASGVREMETPRNYKEEISIRKMNTRRSTRLLEKQTMKLDLNDKEGIKPIDFGGSDREVPNDMEGNVKEDSDDFDCDDSGCIDNTAEHLVSGNHEEGFNAGKDEGSKDSDDIMDPVVDDLVSEDLEKLEFGILSLRVSDASEYQKQDNELQNQTINESEMKSVNDLDSLTGEDILKEGVVLADDAGKEKEITLVTHNCGEESSQLVIESSYEVQPTAVESNGEVNPPPVTENQICSLMAGNPRTLSPCCLDKSEVLVDMAFSTLAADPLQVQMMSSLLQLGSDSDCLICPPSLTLVKKSSNKIPTTSRKINNFLDENKENIENSGMKLELIKEKDKKDNIEAPDSIKNKSLRQLKKIYKEKAQIKNKKHINEDKDFAQVGRVRPALQTLSENRLAASEPEIEI